jgi:hypothetical protein
VDARIMHDLRVMAIGESRRRTRTKNRPDPKARPAEALRYE